MASEDDKNKNAAGFAGLSSLVSDVEIGTDVPKSASATSASAKQEVPDEEQKSATSAQQSSQTQSTAQPYQAPTQPSDNSGWKWVLGIGAVIAVIWMAAGSGSKNQASPSYSSSPSAPSYSPPAATPAAPSRLSEELPPAGTNIVLSSAQLRYCLAEDIRLESAKAVVNNYIDAHVDRFNGMVSDYNNRCGQFRYRKGALESARSEVERYRADLQAEGRGRFSTGAPAAPKLTPQAVKQTPDPTVKAIQQRLNVLGYNIGPADGLMGKGTRAAIAAFQRDKGISVTGVADQGLLLHLQRAVPIANTSTGSDTNRSLSATTPSVSKLPAPSLVVAPPPKPTAPTSSGNQRSSMPPNSELDYTGSNWKCRNGYRKVGDRCDAVQMPDNAELDYTGSNWKCRNGYRKVGERCEAVQMPLNSELDYTGANWKCRNGYRKVEDRCDAVQMPDNSELDYTGSNWKCRNGYRKVGDRCNAVQMPDNAELDYTGSNWKCRNGYRKVGERCDAVQIPANGELDYTGSNWKCRSGYRRSGNECVGV
jgi:peptidoglycan hydrolase-like protein with peptidoglycan-binding domain